MVVPLLGLGIGYAKLGHHIFLVPQGFQTHENFVKISVLWHITQTKEAARISLGAATLTLTMQLSFCLPMMESEGNELCYISHPNHDHRIGCNIFGNLFLTNNWAGYVTHSFESLPQSFLHSHFLCLSSV